MLARSLAVALLATTVVGGAAVAQTTQPTTPAQPATPKAESNTTTAALPAGQLNVKGAWRTSKLVGLDVYNEANEKIGDINEILVDSSGKVAGVVIGVGGFLGMGEHDVAVSMDKLKFVERGAATTTDRTRAAAPAGTNTTGSTASTTAPATGTSPATTASAAARSNANDWVPERAVLNMTKEQLKSVPQFKYSDYN